MADGKYMAAIQSLIVAASLLVLSYLYTSSQKAWHLDTQMLLKDRARDIEQQVEVARALVDQMRGQMEDNLRKVTATHQAHPALGQLKNLNGQLYAADGLGEASVQAGLLKGSVSGAGQVERLSQEVKNELSAALGLSLTLGKVINNNPNYVWSYYTSAHQFMFISPKVSSQEFAWSSELLGKPFWTPAIPEANPTRKIVISDLYNDEAGQGYMISVSAPVYVDDVFRGVVSLDLGLRKLQSSLLLDETIGELSLIDEKGRLVSAVQPFELGQHLKGHEKALAQLGQVVNVGGQELLATVVIPDELYLVHAASKTSVFGEVSRRMLWPILVLVMFVSVLLLLVRLRHALQKVSLLATRDSLTNLLNRRAVLERCQEIFEYSDRYTDRVSLIMMDIDHFKNINDRYGHGAGDEAIRMVAQGLQQNTRRTDCLARIGGEEFLLVMPGTQGSDAVVIAEKLRLFLRQSLFSEHKLSLTVSVGCVERRPGESYDDTMKRVDDLLYRAKHNGRDRVESAVGAGNETVLTPVSAA
jgi:diguanylate cyclase